MFICLILYRTLANHCHNIEQLDLSECNKITDISTESISRHCSKLASINLESCSNTTDNSLKYISDGCPVSTCKQTKKLKFVILHYYNIEIQFVYTMTDNYHSFFFYFMHFFCQN